MGVRLVVGQQTLDLYAEVRILDPQYCTVACHTPSPFNNIPRDELSGCYSLIQMYIEIYKGRFSDKYMTGSNKYFFHEKIITEVGFSSTSMV
jgi:hypothetical protein